MLLGAFAGGAKLIECDSFSKGFRWAAGLAALAAGIVIRMVKEPSFNQFRGSFGGSNEVVTMLLCLVTAILVVWGLSEVFLLAEEAGLRLREVAWLGSHSLLIYLYHMFFAWIISVITGFSIFYEETVPGKTVFLSFLLTLACLALGILRNVVEDKIKSKGKGA
jgi:fucose 4-O-acetylase-like acetyltransferase